MKIHIALCANELFAIPCMITITTIMENNRNSDLSFYILNNGFTETSQAKFQKLADLYKCKIFLIKKDANELNGVSTNNRYSIMTYYRFFLPKILQDLDKVLYMDCDMMVRGSLVELWNIDLTDKACAAVEDQNSDDITNYNRLGLEAEQYFNAGLLLINLDFWRKNDVGIRCIKYLIENPEKCKWNDQDAINVLLKDSIVKLSPTYNFQEGWYKPISQQHYHFKKWDTINSIKDNPVVVHFCSRNKPWHKYCQNPWTAEFVRYARLNSFIGFKRYHRHTFAYRLFNKLSMPLIRIRNHFK